jgi:hypothetical protein
MLSWIALRVSEQSHSRNDRVCPFETFGYLISRLLQPTNRRDAIYRISNRCAFSGVWIKLDGRRDKSRLYGSHFGISDILSLAEASG